MTLLPEHQAYLEAHAITPEIMKKAGLYSITTTAELPAPFAWYGEAAVPAIVFPWISSTGVEVIQLKPDTPVRIEGEVKPRKYLLAKSAPSVLDAIKPDGDIVLICEGSKQHLAAAGYVPAIYAVFGLMGCGQWMDDNIPIPDLAVVEDHDVVICFDADLRSNLEVWSMGEGLAAACRAEGATDVKFVSLPAGRNAGLDDVLARRDPNRREVYLARLLDDAGKLCGKPRARKKRLIESSDARIRIVISTDQKIVIDQITKTLVDRWSSTELFDHGGVISRRRGHIITPLDKGAFLDTLQEAAVTVIETDFGDAYAWPHGNCVMAALSRAARYAPLHRISRAPFVRPDGTICQTPGYDEATGTFLDSGLTVDVPEEPSPEQLRAAVALLLDDWLGDMSFETPADRANVLALVITPIIRGLVELVPMALIDGLQMGVGKNLLADCIAILATGEPLDPLPYTDDNEELRKLITSLFRRSADLVGFDEAHVIGGNALARSITALTYTDRILGVSQTASFPNRVTWMALGNQIQVEGDVIRRVYRISLRPTGANPEDRGPDCFVHPDLRAWTRANRGRLIGAALTIIRAWYAGGSRPSSRGAAFGSFEQWGRMVGGVLEQAGVDDFLGNMAEWRSEAGFDLSVWLSHFKWLWFTFGEKEFFANDVRKELLIDPEGSILPPGIGDPGTRDCSRSIGMAYGRMRDRVLGSQYRLTKVGQDRMNRAIWSIKGPSSHEKRGDEGTEGTLPRYIHGEHALPLNTHTHSHTYREEGVPSVPSVPAVPFDLETASADRLWGYGPGFVRIVGYRDNGAGEAVVTTDPQVVVEAARAGATLVGHNIYGFDLLALARYHELDLLGVSAVDTKILIALADPPPARMKPGEAERYYSLDAVGHRLLGVGKTGDLKALEKEFGGFDLIPVDDERYVDYVKGDVEVTRRLAEHFGPLDDYAVREHEVARLAAQIMLNGFRIDEKLLRRRIAEGEERRARRLAELEPLGLPKMTKDGKRECKSPLATEEGKQILDEAFARLGVKLPRTATRALRLDQETMQAVIDAGGPAGELAEAVAELNGIRTIYDQIEACRVGDRVHPQISFRQASGRWSVTNPGLTVVGKRGGRHVERGVFLPEPGHVIVTADLAQVDARAVAAHSQDPNYLALLAPGIDLHAEIARDVWGDPSRREEAKAIAHGFNYGEGSQTVARTAGVPLDVALTFTAAMRRKFPLIVEWQSLVREQANAGMLLDNGFGRKMRPDPERSWTQAPALVGQGCARDILMEGLLRLPRELWGHLRGVIHDEVVLSVPEDIAVDVERAVVDALSFEWAPTGAQTPVAILAEPGRRRGRNWGAVYGKEAT